MLLYKHYTIFPFGGTITAGARLRSTPVVPVPSRKGNIGPMRLEFRRYDTLPRLAWCIKITSSEEAVEVSHGPWVEVSDGFFCEGAWSGGFSAGGFESGILMGSGGRITKGGLLLVSPNHTLERIYLIRDESTIWASNSLVFTLAQANDDLDPHHLPYWAKLRLM